MHPQPHRRGSTLALTVILAIIITGLVTVMCWVAGESSQRTSSLGKLDQAFFAAEAGAQRVQWYCKNNKLGAITSPLTGTVNGDAYSVSWTTVSGSTIKATSVGTSGSVLYTLSLNMTPPNPAAVLAAGGSFDNKNIDVTGDVVVGGTYANGGNGTITGNMTYYGTASNTTAVSGTVAKGTGAAPTIDMIALGNTLITDAGQTYLSDQTNTTFDFTAIAGTNKVIYVKGNVSNPTFVGTGTLYVTGTFSGGGFGTASNSVNIVAQGDVTTANNITIYGSLYTAGNWNRGKFTLTGMVYAAGSVFSSNYAQSTLTQTTAPWFDPRAATWNTSVVTAEFSGPQP